MSANLHDQPSPTAVARRLVAEGRREDAEHVVADLIRRNFRLAVRTVSITADWSSLNSLNGLADLDDGRRFFFKFHQEEGEEATVEEYYRAELLQRAGLPVDVPAMICREPGQQILLYPYRRDRTLADLCLEMERTQDVSELPELLALQTELDRLTGESYVASLHASNGTLSAAEPIHQLFHNRLVTLPNTARVGGRVARFYQGRSVALPDRTLGWDEFANRRWRINGVDYERHISDLFSESLTLLDPAQLAASGAVTAHGDAHNANVWVERRADARRLVLFDPAFAGEHVPALLADVKATFHNIFAHPFWLYHPAEAEPHFRVAVEIEQDRIAIEHDWALTPLRREFLSAKVVHIWRPLLVALKERDLLPANWRSIVRQAFFCCPTLVMNLLAATPHGATPGRSPKISALSFALAVMAGSEPQNGADVFSRFLDEIQPWPKN
jgi:hypothetical protein